MFLLLQSQLHILQLVLFLHEFSLELFHVPLECIQAGLDLLHLQIYDRRDLVSIRHEHPGAILRRGPQTHERQAELAVPGGLHRLIICQESRLCC